MDDRKEAFTPASCGFLGAAESALRPVSDRGGAHCGLNFKRMDERTLAGAIRDLEMKIAFAERAYSFGMGKVSSAIAIRTLRDTEAMMQDLAEARDAQGKLRGTRGGTREGSARGG